MPNQTVRQAISDIMVDLRAQNLDDKVSKRYIHNKLKDYAAIMIKRDADQRRILNISDIWTEVQCVEFCEAPIVECCNIDIPQCKNVMKSVKPLPETYETFYKELLQIFNPLYAKEFKQITPQEYKDILAREFVDPRIKYFWIANKHVIIPDSKVEIAVFRGVFANPAEAKKLNSCEAEDTNACPGILDQPFICPDYLMPVVKQEVLKDLFNFYKRNVLDESPNLNTNKKVNENQ
jgi:hypothetical protein